tara:strand:- start:25407 stop:26216 length:810 start_codon:yes stop_codon:yes gene_type:complete
MRQFRATRHFAAALCVTVMVAAQAAPEKHTAPQNQRAKLVALQQDFATAKAEWQTSIDGLLDEWRQQCVSKPDLARPKLPAMVQFDFVARYRDLADNGCAEAQLWVIEQHRFSGLDGIAARRDKRSRILSLLATDPSDAWLLAINAAVRLDGFDVLDLREALSISSLMIAMAREPDTKARIALEEGRALDGVDLTLKERSRSLRIYESVAARWPETPTGKLANGLVFEARQLRVGQTAPEIAGHDVDGNPVRLTDYRGQVVVLDFWGFW